MFFDRKPRVKAANDCAESAGSCHSGEPCDAAANDEHLGRLNPACSCHLSCEEPAKEVGRFNNCAVASNICKSAQDIEFLCPANARHAVHGDSGHALRSELSDECVLICRPNHANENLPIAKHFNLAACRRIHFQDNISLGVHACGRCDDAAASFKILRVAALGRDTGAGFDDDVKTHFLEPLDGFWNNRDAAFLAGDLAGNAKFHSGRSLCRRCAKVDVRGGDDSGWVLLRVGPEASKWTVEGCF